MNSCLEEEDIGIEADVIALGWFGWKGRHGDEQQL
jgi:hypothetical protein